jgi:hypothetical protein
MFKLSRERRISLLAAQGASCHTSATSPSPGLSDCGLAALLPTTIIHRGVSDA